MARFRFAEYQRVSPYMQTELLCGCGMTEILDSLWRGPKKLHFLNPVLLQEIYERWIAKFEKPRFKALGDLKRRLEKANG